MAADLDANAQRDVSVYLDVAVNAATEIELQVAVARLPGMNLSDSLSITLNGNTIDPDEIISDSGSRIHWIHAEPGNLYVQYQATVYGAADPVSVTHFDRSLYLRPSRYAEADKFFGFAAGEFDTTASQSDQLIAVTNFVRHRLSYIFGASDPIDGAVDTLLSGAGVCRDYAHLVVALVRALGIPARLVAVYAPGLSPMDFHAVAEALIDDRWVVVDATGLAPRQSLVRISTGRDAADTAFLDNHGGDVVLNSYQVSAVVSGYLPIDDPSVQVQLH
jgi:transglutaminase-like putative cysteine protease